jgi:S1-C subfamily serine protease
MSPERLSRRSFLTALGVSVAAGTAGCQRSDGEGNNASSSAGGSGQTSDGSVYTSVYENAADAVASIRVYYAGGGASQGSGFLMDDNHLVTNQHVVDSADSVYVRFDGTDWREVDVVGEDIYSDLAVLDIERPPDGADPLSFVDTTPEIGTQVVAIGNPFGLSGSVSEGIVSGVNRTLESANNFSIAAGIQTDAAVNPGNSGGPLVNLDGEVVGVINSGGGDNVGFAISSQLARRVLPALIEDGSYDHPYMGVTLQNVSPTVAEANDLEDASGVYIDSTIPGGPADGVLEGSTGTSRVNGLDVSTGGDIVRRLDNTEIATRGDLATYLALETSPDDVMDVPVHRDGTELMFQLTVGTRLVPQV